MLNDLTLKKQFTFNAPVEAVWDALTNPEKIKRYLFGTQTITDWKEGSPIIFTGTWEGTQYKDKGTILKFVKNSSRMLRLRWAERNWPNSWKRAWSATYVHISPGHRRSRI